MEEKASHTHAHERHRKLELYEVILLHPKFLPETRRAYGSPLRLLLHINTETKRTWMP